jgi:hypothetical protein
MSVYTVQVYYNSQWCVWTHTTYNRAVEVYEHILDHWQNCRVIDTTGVLCMLARGEN